MERKVIISPIQLKNLMLGAVIEADMRRQREAIKPPKAAVLRDQRPRIKYQT